MSRSTAVVDHDVQSHRYVLVNFCNVDNDTYQDSLLYLALEDRGVTDTFHYSNLCKADIEALDAPPAAGSTERRPVPFAQKRLFLAAIQCHVHLSRQKGKVMNWQRILPRTYQDYRISEWDCTAEIKPWRGTSVTLSDSEELSRWLKNVKPSRAEFNEYRDEATWPRWNEHFTTTVASQGLSDCIDPAYTPSNPALFKVQQEWLYKTMDDKMLTPHCRTVLKDHIDDKDTRLIWKKILSHNNDSMVASLRASKISTYLTTARLSSGIWRGSQCDFLMNYKEQTRNYNKSATDPYTDSQLCQFLEQSVSDTPNLAGVRQTLELARRAAGSTAKVSFPEYLEELMKVGAVYDNANGIPSARTRPNARRRTYNHELQFDDEPVADQPDLEVNNHTFDTTVEELLEVHQSVRSSRRVMMNKSTWNSLTSDDQKAWDVLSESGKAKILEYAIDRARREASKATPRDQRMASTHDISDQLVFDSDDDEPAIQVSSHHVRDSSNTDFDESDDDIDLLHFATHETKSPPDLLSGNIAQVLSQPSKAQQVSFSNEASVHEVDRSAYYAYSHELRFGSDDDDDSDDYDPFQGLEDPSVRSSSPDPLIQIDDQPSTPPRSNRRPVMNSPVDDYDPFSGLDDFVQGLDISSSEAIVPVSSSAIVEEDIHHDVAPHGHMRGRYKDVPKPTPYKERLKRVSFADDLSHHSDEKDDYDPLGSNDDLTKISSSSTPTMSSPRVEETSPDDVPSDSTTTSPVTDALYRIGAACGTAVSTLATSVSQMSIHDDAPNTTTLATVPESPHEDETSIADEQAIPSDLPNLVERSSRHYDDDSDDEDSPTSTASATTDPVVPISSDADNRTIYDSSEVDASDFPSPLDKTTAEAIMAQAEQDGFLQDDMEDISLGTAPAASLPADTVIAAHDTPVKKKRRKRKNKKKTDKKTDKPARTGVCAMLSPRSYADALKSSSSEDSSSDLTASPPTSPLEHADHDAESDSKPPASDFA